MIAAPGPSLTDEVAEAVQLSGWPTIAVQDAYRLMPWADVVYGCNASWWRVHQDCGGFAGEKWASHGVKGHDSKLEAARNWGVRLVEGRHGEGFSTNPEFIHYGSNSGFQAINLALLFGCKKIVLVGYDMRYVGGKPHFFGSHRDGLFQCPDHQYRNDVKTYRRAKVPDGVAITNATEGSALDCYPIMPLEKALEGKCTEDVPLHAERKRGGSESGREAGHSGVGSALGDAQEVRGAA